jgi:hypothetical protein
MSNNPAKPAGGSGMPLEAFIEDARNLDADQFAERFGSGFLMVTAASTGGRRGSTSTVVVLDSEDDSGGRTAGISVVIHSLRPRDGSGGHLVTIGREPNHDVVVPDVSVSRFHAFAKQEAGGGFLIQDAGSTNGTTVNGNSVMARGAGEPTRLTPGDNVKFGRVELTFADAKAVREFALQAAA